jgi:hypothetical protein
VHWCSDRVAVHIGGGVAGSSTFALASCLLAWWRSQLQGAKAASADVGRVSGVGVSIGQMFTAAGPIAVHAMQRGGVGEVHKILYSQIFRRGGAGE